jgi:nucleoid-associated protein YgaU
MNKPTVISRFFKSSEEVISMFLGLVIVVVVVGLVFNFFQRKRGIVDLPGLSVQKNIDLGEKLTDGTAEKKTVQGTYTVKKGDSLWKIAETNYRSGYNWVDISKANNLKNPGVLFTGQKLILPEVTVKKPVVAAVNPKLQKIEGGTYKVVKGDNLWTISVRAYGDGYQWVEVWKTNKNKLRSPDKLEIGMVLQMPSKK